LDEDFAYSIKAVVFNGATVLAIMDVALLALGIANLPFGLVVLGLSLLGLVIAQQSMSPNERGFCSNIRYEHPNSCIRSGLSKMGNTVLFYDTFLSLGDL